MGKRRELSCYGVVDIKGWNTNVVLPLDRAAELVDIISEGLVFEHYISGEGHGYSNLNQEGKRPSMPAIEVISWDERCLRFQRGHDEIQQRRNKAAAEAEASNVTELKQPAE